jgi:hypothetical protein
MSSPPGEQYANHHETTHASKGKNNIDEKVKHVFLRG